MGGILHPDLERDFFEVEAGVCDEVKDFPEAHADPVFAGFDFVSVKKQLAEEIAVDAHFEAVLCDGKIPGGIFIKTFAESFDEVVFRDGDEKEPLEDAQDGQFRFELVPGQGAAVKNV